MRKNDLKRPSGGIAAEAHVLELENCSFLGRVGQVEGKS